MKQFVVCTGMPILASRLLYDALRSVMPPGVKAPEADMPAERALAPTKHLLTHCPADIFNLERILAACQANRKRLKVIVLIDDPRSILAMRDPLMPWLYAIEPDHAIERNADGQASLTAAGLAPYANAILGAFADDRFETLIVRRSDLQERPSREFDRIEAFTGIAFAGTEQADAAADALAGAIPSAARSRPETETVALERRLALSQLLAPELSAFAQTFGFPALPVEPPTLAQGTVVAYYTQGSLYEAEASRLAASLRRLDLPFHIEAVPDQGSWLANVRAKPAILAALRKRITGPLLYVDVDAVLHSDPWPRLGLCDVDAACCVMRDGLPRSGTVLIADNKGARDFLAAWSRHLDMAPEAWDQTPLSAMIAQCTSDPATSHSIGLLTISLCYVFDRDRSVLCSPPAVPVVEHLQASREQAGRLADVEGAARLERRRARLSELDD